MIGTWRYIMKRLKQLGEQIGGQIREGIDEFFDTIEETESPIQESINKMKKRIPEAIEIVAAAIANEQMLKYAYQEAIDAVQICENKIDSATTDRDVDLEETARLHKEKYLQRASELEQQILEQETVVSTLKASLFEFYNLCQKAEKRAETLSYRQQQAEIRANFYQLFSDFNLPDDNIAFQNMEKELKKTEAKVKTLEKRNRQYTSKVKDIKDHFNVDEALAELKRDIIGSSQND